MIKTYARVGAILRDRKIPDIRCALFIDGRLYSGICDKSRMDSARRWRLFWRLKHNRQRVAERQHAKCGACLTCWPASIADPSSVRMALCPECGNKRCPRANDCANACTGSNDPGQDGSAY